MRSWCVKLQSLLLAYNKVLLCCWVQSVSGNNTCSTSAHCARRRHRRHHASRVTSFPFPVEKLDVAFMLADIETHTHTYTHTDTETLTSSDSMIDYSHWIHCSVVVGQWHWFSVSVYPYLTNVNIECIASRVRFLVNVNITFSPSFELADYLVVTSDGSLWLL